jgi:hypothetical protein
MVMCRTQCIIVLYYDLKVKEVLVNSTLPLESLGKIWDLSDMDHDGALDRHEFIVVRSKFIVNHFTHIFNLSASNFVMFKLF